MRSLVGFCSSGPGGVGAEVTDEVLFKEGA